MMRVHVGDGVVLGRGFGVVLSVNLKTGMALVQFQNGLQLQVDKGVAAVSAAVCDAYLVYDSGRAIEEEERTEPLEMAS